MTQVMEEFIYLIIFTDRSQYELEEELNAEVTMQSVEGKCFNHAV
jgi:hypothetical protein